MPVQITADDLKTQFIINFTFARLVRGPLGISAERLNKIWWEQLPERVRKEIESANRQSEDLDRAGGSL